MYNELLKDVKDIQIHFENEHSKHVYYIYEIKTNKRNELMNLLKEKGISTGIHYPIPLHLQPSLKFLGYKEGDFPIAEKAAKEILSLPMYPELSKEAIEYVSSCIKELLQ